MRWKTIVSTQSNDEWFEDYLTVALAHRPFGPPPQTQHIGAVEASWWNIGDGMAFIRTAGGTPDDRVLAELIVREGLRVAGIEQAQFSFDWAPDDPFRKEATWDDVEEKALRLVQSGAVQIGRNGYNNIVGTVKGDNDTYDTEIMRQDPTTRTITQWSCTCPWDQFAFQRTRQWKKYEGRPCSHVLATFWRAVNTPVDEDVHPSQIAPQPTNPGAPGLFQTQGIRPEQGLGGGQYFRGPPAGINAPQGVPQGMPNMQMMLPGTMPGMATGTPPMPGDPSVIPPFPQAQPDPATMPNPASVPGLKQPSPTNPVQYPGGTFSSWQFTRTAAPASGFANGAIVSTRHEDWGEWQGRTQQGGKVKIPAGSPGEVLGMEPTTGMVNVLFMNEALGVQEHGRMQPWGATGWFWQSDLVLRPDVKPPGPAVQRRNR